MNYNNIIPKKLEEYKNHILIENLKKIDDIKNIILYSKKGYGKTNLKNILIERYKEKYKNLNIINLDLDEDIKKNTDKKEYMINILKLKNRKIFIIDTDIINNESQLYLKSLIKNYKNINFIICLNNVTNLIENFYSFFLMFKLDENFFNIHKEYILEEFKKNYKISIMKIKIINKKSKNFYILKKYCDYIYLFKDEYNKHFKTFESITMNENDTILDNILKNNLDNNIKYIDDLLDDGYSENDIINFLINNLKKVNLKNNNDIYNIILKNDDNYSYIDLMYIIKLLSIT